MNFFLKREKHTNENIQKKLKKNKKKTIRTTKIWNLSAFKMAKKL